MTDDTKDERFPATPGERIRYLRLRERMTQQELASAADISVTYLSEIENNHRTNIGMKILASVASKLDASLDWIVGGETEGATREKEGP